MDGKLSQQNADKTSPRRVVLSEDAGIQAPVGQGALFGGRN